MYMCWLTSRS